MISGAPGTVPSIPLTPDAQPSDRAVELNWTAPMDDGGFDITGYGIYRSTSPGTETRLTSVGGGQTDYNDTSVINGERYYYYVTAENAIGESKASMEINATPGAAPTSPRNPSGFSGSGFVNLSWDPPSDNRGFPVTDYRIYRGQDPDDKVLLTSVTAEQTQYNDTAVVN